MKWQTGRPLLAIPHLPEMENAMNLTPLSLLILSAPLFPLVAADPYQNWRHTRDLTILTTPEGANLLADAAESVFLRLYADGALVKTENANLVLTSRMHLH